MRQIPTAERDPFIVRILKIDVIRKRYREEALEDARRELVVRPERLETVGQPHIAGLELADFSNCHDVQKSGC
jgi:hypothetical protein